MHCKVTWLITAVMLVFALAGGQGKTVTVTGKAGYNITLQTGVTGLHGDYQILWSTGEGQHVIVNFDEGALIRKTSERFHLDIKTGSLTIWPLSINDTGLYQGQIINGNGSRHSFNLTVVEANPIKPTAESPHDTTAHKRSHLAIVVPFVFVCIVLLVCAVRHMKMKGKCWGNSEAV